jgi:8-oxo-dGTP diphosphatase
MRLNIIPIFDKDMTQVLFCIRSKDPFKGMYNFVGGKVEGDESDILAAFRELNEETGITPDDVELVHFMNLYYAADDYELIVFAGRLNKDVELIPEKNRLEWVDINDNFFDIKKYAGNGNIGLILEELKISADKLF